MAIKKRPINYTFAKVGDPVHSKKVGSKEPFNGLIVEISAARAIVRDGEGRRWVREWRELEAVQ